MAKQRKQRAAAPTQPSSIEEIPENEQWRIIDQTGVLKQVPQEWSSVPSPARPKEQTDGNDDDPFSPFCNEMFNAFCFTIPMSSLYIMMDVLAHRQYAQEITTSGILEKVVSGVPFLFILIFYTLRHKAERRMQALMFVVSIACGSRLIYIVNWASWKVVVNQCAALGTIWVHTIVHLELLPAVGALAIVGAYVKWKDLKIIF